MTSRRRRFFAELLSSENREIELHLAAGFFGVVVFLVLAVFNVMWLHTAFDMVAFGTGLGAIITGTGISGLASGFQRRYQERHNDVAPPTAAGVVIRTS